MSSNETLLYANAERPDVERFEDFLTPQQRAEAIAEILSIVAVRIIRQRHESQNPDSL